MPWDGSGGFDRAHNWVNDRDGAIDITASRMDAEFDNYAAGLEACVTKNGENSATANLPMDGFNHTNVASATSRSNYARTAELQDGGHVSVDATGTANTQAIILTPAITAYAKYQRFSFLPVADNTGACTLNVNGLGAKNIKLQDGSNPTAGDIDATGVAEVIYNGSQFILLNPSIAQSGTWTPAIIGSTTAGTGWVYSTQAGTYTRHGKMIFLSFKIAASTLGAGAAGNLLISGLPSFSFVTGSEIGGSFGSIGGVTLSSSYSQFGLQYFSGTALGVINIGHPSNTSSPANISTYSVNGYIAGTIVLSLN